MLRIWTVIPEPDFDLEGPIYEAQLRFLDGFPEIESDFMVLYRFGKALDEVAPSGANPVEH